MALASCYENKHMILQTTVNKFVYFSTFAAVLTAASVEKMHELKKACQINKEQLKGLMGGLSQSRYLWLT